MPQKLSKSPTSSPRDEENKRKNSRPQNRYESEESTDNEETDEDPTKDDHEQNSKHYKEPEMYPQFVHCRPSKRRSLHQELILESAEVRPPSNNVRNRSLNARKIRNYETKSTKQETFNNKQESGEVSSVKMWYKILSVVVVILLICALKYYLPNNNGNNESIDLIKEKFPNQDTRFWKAIITGINDTILLERPTSYIFLFESKGEKTIKKLLAEVSKYAVFELTHNITSAIDFKDEILKSPKFSNIHDYGSVITHIKDKLENKGLMIIENLDEVPEKYALAFHNFCDEYAPLVKKSAFFFTLKVDKFKETPLYDLRNVEKVLRNNWPNMEEDIFIPLFTRLSSMILRVYP